MVICVYMIHSSLFHHTLQRTCAVVCVSMILSMNYISAQEIPILVDTPLADTVTNTKNTPPAVTDDIALFPTTEPLPVVPT